MNTRRLLISLPSHKVTDWLRDIDSILLTKKVHYKLLDSILGRLNHVACILHPMRHFMGRLYRARFRAKARSGWTSLSAKELSNLSIHSDFLHYAKRGVSLSNIASANPQLYTAPMPVNLVLVVTI